MELKLLNQQPSIQPSILREYQLQKGAIAHNVSRKTQTWSVITVSMSTWTRCHSRCVPRIVQHCHGTSIAYNCSLSWQIRKSFTHCTNVRKARSCTWWTTQSTELPKAGAGSTGHALTSHVTTEKERPEDHWMIKTGALRLIDERVNNFILLPEQAFDQNMLCLKGLI